MAQKQAANKICIIPNCGKEAVSRGLCSYCYGQARKAILCEEITWEWLEHLRLALPKASSKRPNPFREAMRASKTNKSKTNKAASETA